MSSDSGNSGTSQVTERTRARRLKMAEPVSDPATNPTPTTIHMKIPPFWPEKPAIWFAQVEGQFAIMKVTDETAKFYHILATLDRQYAAEVEDVLTGKPDYQRLKNELIKRLSVSRENKVKQLLMHEQLGARKPSQFLRHLQHLAGPEIPEDFLRTIWSSRLPTGMQSIVASQSALSLDALAELADRINDIATPTQQVSAASISPVDELTRQVAELTRQVSALTTQVNRQSRPRDRGSRHQQQQRNGTPHRSQSSYRRFPICWYHNKHGSKAVKCIKPCDFKAGNTPGSQ